MHRRLGLMISLVGILLVGIAWSGTAVTSFDEARDKHSAFADTLCRNSVNHADAFDLQYAFSALYLNENQAEANQRLRQAYDEVRGDAEAMTAEVAEKFKWQMRWWIRIYYLFREEATAGRGRLSRKNQDLIEELFWYYGVRKSTLARAQLKYIWVIQGSENHDMMDLSNAFLALQVVKDVPAYRQRRLPDGHTAQEHYDAWNAYYQRYCGERAARGLYVEMYSPIYGKYLIPEIVNICDFAEDELLRRRATMLLHVTWADWAVDQLNGVRGGGKTRVYPGHYCQRGTSDSYYLMTRPMVADDAWLDVKRYNHPNAGYIYIMATTAYRWPDVIIDLATTAPERAPYTYVSLRPGRMTSSPDRPALVAKDCWYDMAASDPRLVRYDYCTPDYIMGSLWVDPAMERVFRVYEKTAAEADHAYAAISSQNRWQGVIFATDVNARVFPQCLGTKKGDHRVTYDQHVAVQHDNVMIVRKNPSQDLATAMRVFFFKGARRRLQERDGWWLLNEGDAFLAAKGFSRNGNETCGYEWDDQYWLRLLDDEAPVVFVSGRTADFADTEAFGAYVTRHEALTKDDVFYYRWKDAGGEANVLSLPWTGTALPRVNGRPIDLAPRKVYDCPYLQSEYGSGVITVRSAAGSTVIDFNRNVIVEGH